MTLIEIFLSLKVFGNKSTKRLWPTTNSTSTLIMLMVFANNLTSKKSASWGQSPRQPEYNCCWGNIHWKTGKHSIFENNQLYLYLFSYLFIYLFVYWKNSSNVKIFNEEDVINIFPVVKHINPRATDAYNFYTTGQSKIQQGYLKASLYSL